MSLREHILKELDFNHSRSLEGMYEALIMKHGFLFTPDIEQALSPLVTSGEVVIEDCGCVYKVKLE